MASIWYWQPSMYSKWTARTSLLASLDEFCGYSLDFFDNLGIAFEVNLLEYMAFVESSRQFWRK